MYTSMHAKHIKEGVSEFGERGDQVGETLTAGGDVGTMFALTEAGAEIG